jgi:hypothetical protein
MNSRMLPFGAFIFVMLVPGDRGVSQSISGSGAGNTEAARAPDVKLSVLRSATPRAFRPSARVGFDTHAGLGGIGFDVATPLSRNFNLRAGSDFFAYSTTFQDQGATVTINSRLRSAHASLDWFPFRGRFRLSPQIVFANNNRVQAGASIPAGSTISLNGQDYVSSFADPLRGGGSVDFRRVSPGLTLGLGNITARERGHFSVPVEAGFYYVGQPGLKVNFSGSACYPGLPETIACNTVSEDPSFQENLDAFVARNRHNLSYVSFFPTFSVGFGYAF